MSSNDPAEVAGGYDVAGVTMKPWSERPAGLSDVARDSAPIDDVEYARRVCQIIDAPHYVMSF